jgi:hypothetical protein
MVKFHVGDRVAFKYFGMKSRGVVVEVIDPPTSVMIAPEVEYVVHPDGIPDMPWAGWPHVAESRLSKPKPRTETEKRRMRGVIQTGPYRGQTVDQSKLEAVMDAHYAHDLVAFAEHYGELNDAEREIYDTQWEIERITEPDKRE